MEQFVDFVVTGCHWEIVDVDRNNTHVLGPFSAWDVTEEGSGEGRILRWVAVGWDGYRVVIVVVIIVM